MKTNSQEESDASALRKKRNMRCLVFIVVVLILKIITILVFTQTIMRVRNPKLRLSEISIETLKTNTNPSSSSSSSPSFSMNLKAQVTIQNPNFGYFNSANTNARIMYGGTQVGGFVIEKAQVSARSTKRFDVTTVYFSSEKVSINSGMDNDVDSGIFTISIRANLNGKVHILFGIFKKKKYAEMDCTMNVNTTLKEVQNLTCKS